MYDLIDIIDIKLSGMDRLIHRWMTNHQLIKSTLLHDIKSIKMTINKYHKKYVICKEWENYGRCKYGAYCWNLHPLNNNNNNNNKQKWKENKQEISEKKINFPEFSDQNENDNNGNSEVDYSEDEYYDTEIDNDSSDDSDYNDDDKNFEKFFQNQKFQEFSYNENQSTYHNSESTHRNSDNEKQYNKPTYRKGDNGNQCDSSQGYQPAKRKKKKNKKKSKKWRKKEAVKKEIAQAKNFFCNKEKLQKMVAKTDNKHIKYLIQHYKQPICFKYMNGRCNDINCTFKHPKKCDNYKHNNGYKCKYGDQCWFAHINFKQQPNGTVVTNYENINKNKNNSKKDNNNDNKKNNNNNQKKNYNNNNSNNNNKLNNNNNDKIEKDLEQRVQELEREKNSVDGIPKSNFGNIGKLNNDKTYCDVAKEKQCKQDSNMNEETKDNDNNKNNNNNDNDETDNENDLVSFEFACEVVTLKMAAIKGKDESERFRKRSNEIKERVMIQIMDNSTKTLIRALWLQCEGKTELIEKYFNAYLERLTEIERKNNNE